jgi:hypothetical protein
VICSILPSYKPDSDRPYAGRGKEGVGLEPHVEPPWGRSLLGHEPSAREHGRSAAPDEEETEAVIFSFVVSKNYK